MTIVRDVVGQDPLGDHLFVFFSKRCERVRIVYWDRDGSAMWTKRLDRRVLRVPEAREGQSEAVVEIDEGVLEDLLDGIEVERTEPAMSDERWPRLSPWSSGRVFRSFDRPYLLGTRTVRPAVDWPPLEYGASAGPTSVTASLKPCAARTR
jgi:hypothetical protein